MTAADVSLPKVPKKVTAPKVAPTPEIETVEVEVLPPREPALTPGQALKLVGGVLRNNPDSALLCEAIREIISGTGLDTRHHEQAAETTEEEEV